MLPPPAVLTLPDEPQDTTGPSGYKGSASLRSASDPRRLPAPSPQNCSPVGQSQPLLVLGVIPPQVEQPAFALTVTHMVSYHSTLQPTKPIE